MIRTILYGRVASMTALAVAASSVPNAIAVGPMSSGPSASPTESSAAMRIRRFLTTRKRTSCLRRARRISAISLTLRPRYSDTIIVRALASSSRSSTTVASLASVGHGASYSYGTRTGVRRWASTGLPA